MAISFHKSTRASADDWAGPNESGAFNSSDTYYYIGNLSGTASKVGLRFQSLAIPQGAVIEAAYLQPVFTGVDAGTPNILVKGVAADNAAAPADLTASNALTRTTASVAWSITGGTNEGDVLNSSDISTVIQEIVDRAGWASGNALTLFLETDSASGNYRQIYTVDNTSTRHPRLYVRYTAGGNNVHTFYDIASWTAPTSATLTVECWGAGGWGGFAGVGARCGGGGGGAYSLGSVAVTSGNSYSARPGRGAVGGSGDSYFVDASTVMAKAGGKANDEFGIGTTPGAAGGAAGSGVGTTKYSGGTGGDGGIALGGGGGGSATASANGGNAAAEVAGTGEASGGTGGMGQGAVGSEPGGGGAGGGTSGSSDWAYAGAGRVKLTWAAVVAPAAAFSMTPLSGTSPLSSVATESSTNTPTAWTWTKRISGGAYVDFADKNAQHPTEVFTEGTWDVKLLASNGGGSDEEEKLAYVVVSAASTGPVFSAVAPVNRSLHHGTIPVLGRRPV